MRIIRATGATGPEPDISRVRFWLRGLLVASVNVPTPNVPGTPFRVAFQQDDTADDTFEFAFDDLSGNVLNRRRQTIGSSTTDTTPPTAPSVDLQIVGVIHV